MRLNVLFIALFAILALLSCDNELDVTADWKNIPVIYALVDGNIDVNYLRVEKGFLDPENSGEAIAQIADSLYYGPDVTVRVTNIRNGTSVVCQRVNLEDEGFTRTEGQFATSPNIGYKLITSDLGLEENDELKLELIDAGDNIMTEATTSVIGTYELPITSPTNPLRFRDDINVSFALRSDEQAARFYDFKMLINYNEAEISNPNVTTDKTLEWVVETNLERARTSASGGFQSLTVFRLAGQEFFRFLGANIEENSNVVRNLTGVNLQYDAGGEELFNYINIGLANTGITSNQIVNNFTNFDNDAIGIFSSRTSITNEDPFNLDTNSQDSLREGRFTRLLNFN